MIEKGNSVTNKRNLNLDLIRCVAVILVISVHFLHNNEFYENILVGKKMFLMTMIRTYSMICVPLFLILTGYLMNRKKLEKRYYKGIIKTLLIYIIASIFCILFKKYYLNSNVTIKTAILGIFSFKNANYSWYIEMYIGLFILIPFLNMIYNNLKDRKDKRKLIATFMILTTLPSVLNIFKISGQNAYDKLTIDWWKNLYPITYYFMGAYLCEYKNQMNLKKSTNLILIIFIIILSTIFNYSRSYGKLFEKGAYVQFESLENVLLAVMVFLFFNNLKLDRVPQIISRLIIRVSKLSLGTYLISSIFDTIFYKKLNEQILNVPDRVKYYLLIVLTVFFCSLFTAWIMDIIANFILKILENTRNKYKIRKETTNAIK